ncbi:hypothetical protein Metvu_0129 [Methanocaldococcus vulcanius M7]|uniref:Uncharacterized protein n=1 Tax=Methanocaldococcus vulcanius (strain ATCC 700851 / DSM 12094 / M7) TaxID=579137 RepID=C9REJ5_METVM|nr:hypothetical protein Metvu_0129 [Methanocaldococcus vulcanius M7]
MIIFNKKFRENEYLFLLKSFYIKFYASYYDCDVRNKSIKYKRLVEHL